MGKSFARRLEQSRRDVCRNRLAATSRVQFGDRVFERINCEESDDPIFRLSEMIDKVRYVSVHPNVYNQYRVYVCDKNGDCDRLPQPLAYRTFNTVESALEAVHKLNKTANGKFVVGA